MFWDAGCDYTYAWYKRYPHIPRHWVHFEDIWDPEKKELKEVFTKHFKELLPEPVKVKHDLEKCKPDQEYGKEYRFEYEPNANAFE